MKMGKAENPPYPKSKKRFPTLQRPGQNNTSDNQSMHFPNGKCGN